MPRSMRKKAFTLIELLVVIAIIAILDTVTDDGIAAAGVIALTGAGIGIDIIAVVAFFDARLDDIVSTAGERTVVATGIGLDLIAIVAGFNTGVGDAIATSSG